MRLVRLKPEIIIETSVDASVLFMLDKVNGWVAGSSGSSGESQEAETVDPFLASDEIEGAWQMRLTIDREYTRTIQDLLVRKIWAQKPLGYWSFHIQKKLWICEAPIWNFIQACLFQSLCETKETDENEMYPGRSGGTLGRPTAPRPVSAHIDHIHPQF